jgi:hypothetical protein
MDLETKGSPHVIGRDELACHDEQKKATQACQRVTGLIDEMYAALRQGKMIVEGCFNARSRGPMLAYAFLLKYGTTTRQDGSSDPDCHVDE